MGKSSINGPFSMAMLNNQRVLCFVCIILFLPASWTTFSSLVDWASWHRKQSKGRCQLIGGHGKLFVARCELIYT